MSIITYLKTRKKKRLVLKLRSLKKLSYEYLETAKSYEKSQNYDYTIQDFSNESINSYLSFRAFASSNYYFEQPPIYSSYDNYWYFYFLYKSTERKIKKIQLKLQKLQL